MITTTKQVNKVVLCDNVLKSVIHAELYKAFRNILTKKYQSQEKQFFSDTWIAFSFRHVKGWYNRERQIAVPVLGTYVSNYDNCFDLPCMTMQEKEVVTLFNTDCPAEIMAGIKSSRSFCGGHWVGFAKGSYCVETGQFSDWNDSDSVPVGVVFMQLADFKEKILSETYEVLIDDVFRKAVAVLKKRKISEVDEQTIDKLVTIFSLDRARIKKEVTAKVMNNFIMTPEITDLYTEKLLSCDASRADLERYDKKCLEDVNSGHWELWSEGEPKAKEGQVLATLAKPLIARNPIADIHYDGLIGIDFGTKSTIVSKQDGKEKTTLLRVGIGQLSKTAEAYHYENPTIMEFRDLKKFIADYTSRNGRPETSINDLRVSHAANNDLKACDKSDDFYSYFYDMKQWCGDTVHHVKLIDQKGVERVLPAFVNLKQGDFNPLEFYAYYLGLYINNMRDSNGIYLDYVLSFPVTYEKAVKEKILESFTNGLKKSLPNTILQNEEVMRKFRVRQGVSEPAAYAITALQGYHFEPDEDENIFYAIFDFGGGTTDFDFGLWRCAGDTREEERYDYVIEHFGSEGDKYLGGENLLALMAFEVFKANAQLLQKGRRRKSEKGAEEKEFAGFSFSKPKECDDFPGSETLISNSQEAKRNTKQLMEALRPFWEGIVGIDESSDNRPNEVPGVKAMHGEQEEKTISYKGYLFKSSPVIQSIVENGEIIVDLFDKEGNSKKGQKLFVLSKPNDIDLNLVDVLEKRIERGVSNFFDSVILAFANKAAEKSGVDGIQIFLAGNSSKSPILKKLFRQYIAEKNSEIKKEKGTDGDHFHLYPPLGTKDAMELQKELGIPVDENDVSAPTGKTGVAYGLIAGREGGTIKVLSEVTADKQTKFRYNIGKARRGKFQMVLDRNDVVYGQWERFIDAGVEDFEIYYTSLPSAGKMSVDDPAIHKKRCRLPYVDASADVYIRAIEEAPDDIEYVISKNEAVAEDAEVIRVHLGE